MNQKPSTLNSAKWAILRTVCSEKGPSPTLAASAFSISCTCWLRSLEAWAICSEFWKMNQML